MTTRALFVALLLAVLPGCRTLYWSLSPAPPQEEIAHLKHVHVALEANRSDRPEGWPEGFRLALTYTTPNFGWAFVPHDSPLPERTQDEVRHELSNCWWSAPGSRYVEADGEYLALIEPAPGEYWISQNDGQLRRYTDCVIRVYVKEPGRNPPSPTPTSDAPHLAAQ